jgi:enoyl-CoA hydratase/carnithine racemase
MSDILIEKHGHVSVITLNRPNAHNALSRSMRGELEAVVKDFNADPEQYVAIVTGAGERAFSSGADLKEMSQEVGSGGRMPVNAWPDMAGISDGEKPVIAAVNGLAVAGGFEIALSCDIRIASTNAWFGLSEVKIGVIAGVGTNILPRLLPMGTAMDLILSGDRLSAEDAYRLGLVQALVEPEKLMETALKKAETIAANSQAAVWGSKKIMKFWRDLMLAEQQNFYEAVVHRVLLSGDVLEGPRAFAEKRPPKFRNRWPSL